MKNESTGSNVDSEASQESIRNVIMLLGTIKGIFFRNNYV